MKLTEEQLAAVKADGNIRVDARPGSGKTRVVTARAINSARALSNSIRKVACVTFTNAAVDEMERRVTQMSSVDEADRVEFFTIHSFALSQIFRPYHQTCPGYVEKYELVSGEDDRARDLLLAVLRRNGLRLRPHEIENLLNCPISPAGQPLLSDAGQAAAVTEYWEAFRSRSWIDFSLLLFESLRILRMRPEVARSLSAKYKYILVDEFQDTTSVQLDVLKQIFNAGTTYFCLVGDVNQSLYRFAGTDSAASAQFASEIGIQNELPLSGNFRSSSNIVSKAEALISCSPPMRAVGVNAGLSYPVEIYSASPPTAVVSTFVAQIRSEGIELGKCAVLAAWWTDLLPIARHCIANHIPTIGPGARPYKRGRLIVPILENLAAAANSSVGLASTQRALARSVDEFTGADRSPILGWNGRKLALDLRAQAIALAETSADPFEWIVAMGDVLDESLARKNVVPNSARFRASAQEVVDDIVTGGKIDPQSVTIQTLGIFAEPEMALKLLTIHAAKGREFDAVAVVGANEGKFPHFSASSSDDIEDGRRAFYVGMTRAKRILHIVVSNSDYRDRESRFVARIR